MIPEHDDNVQLSEAGAARRDQMLHDLIGEMKVVRRQRRLRRNVAIASVPMIVIGVGLMVWLIGGGNSKRPTNDQPSQIVVNDGSQNDGSRDLPAPQPAQAHRSMVVEFVKTDSQIAERYRAAALPRVVMLDDAALLDALVQLDRPAGLIRSEGRTWLTADVTDHRGG